MLNYKSISEKGELIHFKHLSIKSKIPSSYKYEDLGAVDNPYEKMVEIHKLHNKHNYRNHKYDPEKLAGTFFEITTNNKCFCYITYKNYKNFQKMKLIAVHEETHALHFLRPDNLERAFMDLYGLKIDIVNKERFFENNDINIERIANENEVYPKESIHSELIARVMTKAYFEKRNWDFEIESSLDETAQKLYYNLKI